jgi:hypothetical protein
LIFFAGNVLNCQAPKTIILHQHDWSKSFSIHFLDLKTKDFIQTGQEIKGQERDLPWV